MTRPERPLFYGVETYQDTHNRFSFRFPTGWHKFDPLGDQEGVIFSPQAKNPKTWFSVLINSLGEHVTADDFEDLRQGVDEGIMSLPGAHIEHSADDPLNNLLKFERIYTFEEGGVTRKRKVWIMYVDRWLMVVAWQGENEEEYKYWMPMGNYAFQTFHIPEALWFATDPELSAALREKSNS